MRKLLIAVSTLAFVAGSVPAVAETQCRDTKGKFIKCANARPAQPTRCKDAKGKFAKCGTPGAKPVK